MSSANRNMTTFQNNMIGMMSVPESLEAMTLSNKLVSFIEANKASWTTFGTRNSHLLRNQLMKMFADDRMTKEAKVMIYFFHSVVMDNNRILGAMDSLDEDIKKETWFEETKTFLSKRMVKLTKSANSSKFASVHVPGTNPGLDCLFGAMVMTTPTTQDDIVNGAQQIAHRRTFAQLNLSSTLQEINKVAVKSYWEDTVQIKDKAERQKSTGKGFETGFVEEYYNTSAGDMYWLVNKDMTEYITAAPYTIKDIQEWYAKVHGFGDKKDEEAAAAAAATEAAAAEAAKTQKDKEDKDKIAKEKKASELKAKQDEKAVVERMIAGSDVVPESESVEDAEKRASKKALFVSQLTALNEEIAALIKEI
jgi:hypothetical protein